VEPGLAGLYEVASAGGVDIVARATPVAIWVLLRLILAAGLGLSAVIASIVVSVTTARALVAQLERLRNAAHDLADERLPVDLFRRMRELFATGPIAKRIEAETAPGPAVQEDQDIVDAGLDQGYCGYHAMGTCAMGPHEHDVVDAQLRVRGVDQLRVVDCSALPIMVSGNLNGPMMAMAWRASDLIRWRG
jgi:choline dehydrogenase-like flavoprotein